MERLRKAMERARADRQRVTTQPPPAPVPSPSREPPTAPPREADGSGVQIQYTRTARVAVDPNSLQNGRILLREEHLDLAGVHEGVADAYKILRTQILHRMRAKSRRTLAITSPSIGDGKTTTSINLAISLARDVNQTVLLVDFDLKRPSIGRYFTGRDSLGLIDCLTGDVELADVLVNPGIERLVILPGGKRIRHSSELLSSPRVVQLVEELKSRYEDRLILFDMPPLFAGDDVIAFLPHVDAVMLVVEDGKVSREQLVHANELLGEKSIGMVLNKAESGSASPGYYY
jgi:protein-tyrosine kinase